MGTFGHCCKAAPQMLTCHSLQMQPLEAAAGGVRLLLRPVLNLLSSDEPQHRKAAVSMLLPAVMDAAAVLRGPIAEMSAAALWTCCRRAMH